MTELTLGSIPVAGMLLITLGSYMYMRGGRNAKWQRRFIGSFIVSSGVWVESILMGNFTWWLLALYPLCIGSFVLGYGSDDFSGKLRKRGTVVLASLMSGILLAWVFGGWAVLPIEITIAMVTIYLGIRNPIPAATEEYFICVCMWMPKLLYVFA